MIYLIFSRNTGYVRTYARPYQLEIEIPQRQYAVFKTIDQSHMYQHFRSIFKNWAWKDFLCLFPIPHHPLIYFQCWENKGWWQWKWFESNLPWLHVDVSQVTIEAEISRTLIKSAECFIWMQFFSMMLTNSFYALLIHVTYCLMNRWYTKCSKSFGLFRKNQPTHCPHRKID